MQEKPDPQLRGLMQDFYRSIRENDTDKLEELSQNGLPLAWVQSMSETSLPEYAMKHGSVEASWWLMSKGIMPESWSEFSGGAWKAFMKKGWQMVMSQDSDLSLGTYKNIMMVGVKATGERLPSFLEQSGAQLSTQAKGLFGKLSRSVGAFINPPAPNLEDEQEDQPKVTPKEIKPRVVEPATPASRVDKMPSKKEPTSKPSPSSMPSGRPNKDVKATTSKSVAKKVAKKKAKVSSPQASVSKPKSRKP